MASSTESPKPKPGETETKAPSASASFDGPGSSSNASPGHPPARLSRSTSMFHSSAAAGYSRSGSISRRSPPVPRPFTFDRSNLLLPTSFQPSPFRFAPSVNRSQIPPPLQHSASLPPLVRSTSIAALVQRASIPALEPTAAMPSLRSFLGSFLTRARSFNRRTCNNLPPPGSDGELQGDYTNMEVETRILVLAAIFISFLVALNFPALPSVISSSEVSPPSSMYQFSKDNMALYLCNFVITICVAQLVTIHALLGANWDKPDSRPKYNNKLMEALSFAFFLFLVSVVIRSVVIFSNGPFLFLGLVLIVFQILKQALFKDLSWWLLYE